ncbi:MAG: TIGR01777 family oxidoreductase [Gammaproteobacteria bacterium]|nr:TIGR01777 family oxidoreductase [Gammaproteobacteria bacterium]
MHVLITGGTGLIGTALAKALLADGHGVTILTRQRNPRLSEGAVAQLWDGKTSEDWGHLVNEVDAVVNLAGENIAGQGPLPGRWTVSRKEVIRQSRIGAGLALAQAIADATKPPAVLVQASGIGYYGTSDDEPIDEEAPAGTDFLATLAVDWEASTRPVEDKGVRRVVIRTGAVLSTSGGALPKLLLPYQMYVGGPAGSGRQFMPWIHIDDEVNAIRFLIEQSTAQGAFNLCAPSPVTNREFGNTLGRVMHRPSLLPVPAFVLHMLLGEVADLVLEGQRAFPKRLQSLGYEFRFAELEPALRDLLSRG